MLDSILEDLFALDLVFCIGDLQLLDLEIEGLDTLGFDMHN